jgi:hypothetical protein
LSLPLDQVDVSIAAGESGILLVTNASEASRWMRRDLPTHPGYAAALAVAETVDG